MVDLFTTFKSNIFLNVANILPEPATISRILELFKDDGFIPSTIQELTPKGPQLRLRMSSPDQGWSAIFLSDRIAIDRKCKRKQTGSEMADFMAGAERIAEKLFKYLDQKSNRLAFIANAILKEMTSEKLAGCYDKLFIPLSIHRSNVPFEWASHSVSEKQVSLIDTSETVNVITDIIRLEGQLILGAEIKTLNRITFQYEFNTTQKNKDTRFTADHIHPFMNIAKETYEEVVTDLEAAINA